MNVGVLYDRAALSILKKQQDKQEEQQKITSLYCAAFCHFCHRYFPLQLVKKKIEIVRHNNQKTSFRVEFFFHRLDTTRSKSSLTFGVFARAWTHEVRSVQPKKKKTSTSQAHQ